MAKRNLIVAVLLAISLHPGRSFVSGSEIVETKPNTSHACATPFQTSTSSQASAVSQSSAVSSADEVPFEHPADVPTQTLELERKVVLPKEKVPTSLQPIRCNHSVEHSDYHATATCLPGLNTRLDIGMIDQSVPVAHVESRNEKKLFTELRADLLADDDLVCEPCRGLESNKQTSNSGAVAVERDIDRPMLDKTDGMLQPLRTATMLPANLPNRHDTSDSKLPVKQVLVTLSDNVVSLPSEYSSVADKSSKSDFEQREFHTRDQLEIENGVKNPASSVGAALNFSDTPNDQLTQDFQSVAAYRQEQVAINQVTGLMIHPPRVQPFNDKQHTFVVENRGRDSAKDVKIELTVSNNAKIVAALPDNSVITPSKAVFRFDEIIAGDQQQLHLTAISTDGAPIDFEANLVTRSTFGFVASGSPGNGNLAKVQHQFSNEHSVQQATSQAPLPLNAAPSQDGPRLVRNPFVDNYQGGQPAGQYQGHYR